MYRSKITAPIINVYSISDRYGLPMCVYATEDGLWIRYMYFNTTSTPGSNLVVCQPGSLGMVSSAIVKFNGDTIFIL